jgi:DNA-directed RNA polymerase specialized sigma24 family protein
MADFPQDKWPGLKDGYIDEFGRIDADIHAAAGEIWPRAAAFAQGKLHDIAAGQLILLKVCAKLTTKRASGAITIQNLKAYLMRSYVREVFIELKEKQLREVPAGETLELSSHDVAVNLNRKILIEQVMALMDGWSRQVFELRALGHSFEEIGKMLRKSSASVRSRYSKQLFRIKRELGNDE